jgi:hypothetical protein
MQNTLWGLSDLVERAVFHVSDVFQCGFVRKKTKQLQTWKIYKTLSKLKYHRSICHQYTRGGVSSNLIFFVMGSGGSSLGYRSKIKNESHITTSTGVTLSGKGSPKSDVINVNSLPENNSNHKEFPSRAGPDVSGDINASPDKFPLQNSGVGSGALAGSFVNMEEDSPYRGNDEYAERFLSNYSGQISPQHNNLDAPFSSRSDLSDGAAAAAAEMFSHTALSLGMDNEDLLFNLMYFGDGDAGTFGQMMDGVQNETLALHSENNTPYKLKPASTAAIDGLHKKIFGVDVTNPECQNNECECAVCKDVIETGAEVLQIPICQHFFHEECVLRWIKLVRS